MNARMYKLTVGVASLATIAAMTVGTSAQAHASATPSHASARAAATAGPHVAHHDSTFVINVPARNSWTYTSIYVQAGQQVKITASGTIHVGSGVSSGPTGKTFNSSSCGRHTYTSSYGFLAPGLNCWALVFSVGGYAAFPTGTSITFVSPVSDYLQLGVNDDYFRDNSGSFNAKVSL